MTERARREYAEALRPHYQAAGRSQRGRLLDEGNGQPPGAGGKGFGYDRYSFRAAFTVFQRLYEGMVTPAGFEPAISTLKGSRPGPG